MRKRPKKRADSTAAVLLKQLAKLLKQLQKPDLSEPVRKFVQLLVDGIQEQLLKGLRQKPPC